MTIYIILASLSFIFLSSYVIFSLYLYKKEEQEKFSIKNIFPFEVAPKRNNKHFYINTLLWMSLLTFFLGFLYFAIKHFNILFVFTAISALFIAISVLFINILPLNYLREHLYASLGLIIGSALLNALLVTYEIRLFRVSQDYLLLLPLINSGLCLVTSLVSIFFPRLFFLDNELDAYGNPVRRKMYPLALFEWILTFLMVFASIPLIFIA